ncbi:MAG: hypothetical protein HYX81_05415 [Chloroflexi bacterium]|nr:hypothetical protein [Chloroflexota bacterium]
MEVNWDYLRPGYPSQVISTLNRALGQFARQNGKVYVGATGSCYSCEYRHQREEWPYMVYVYETQTKKHAREIEKKLIDHCQVHGYATNVRAGGAGLREGAGRYYVYVCM